jgi:hypothetical protein
MHTLGANLSEILLKSEREKTKNPLKPSYIIYTLIVPREYRNTSLNCLSSLQEWWCSFFFVRFLVLPKVFIFEIFIWNTI